MSKSIKVKEQYLNTVIGFNNSGAPLGLRNDLHILYEIAVKTEQQHLLDMFETTPSTDQLEEMKVESFLQKQELKKADRERKQGNNASRGQKQKKQQS